MDITAPLWYHWPLFCLVIWSIIAAVMAILLTESSHVDDEDNIKKVSVFFFK